MAGTMRMIRVQENVEIGGNIGLFFDLGGVANTPYGSASKLSGTVPLLLPYGEFVQPRLLDDESRFEEFARQKSLEYADAFPNDLDGDIIVKIKTALTFGAQLYPDEDISLPKMEAYVGISILAAVMDDVVDNLGEDERWSYKDANKVMGFVAGLFGGSYKTWDEIPNPLEALVPFNYFIWKISELSRKLIPGFESKNNDFVSEFQNAMCSMIILSQRESEAEGVAFSANSRAVFGAHNNGILSFLEYIAVAQNIQLSEQIRSHICFQRMKESAGIACHAMNDAYGIRRDIRKRQIKDSNILTSVVSKGVPLQKAFNDNFSALTDAMKDIKIAAKLLRDTHFDDQNLMNYIRCLELIVDGQIYFHARVQRYGDAMSKIVRTE